jgi:hypothetical protein
VQAPVAQLDAFQLALPQPSRETPQPSIELLPFCRQPLIGRRGQA